MKEDILMFFDDAKEMHFEDADEGYKVILGHAIATICVDDEAEEICCSTIFSHKEGAGGAFIQKFEEFVKHRNYKPSFSNIINPKLEGMLMRRSYQKELRPFSERCGIMDPVDVWVKTQ